MKECENLGYMSKVKSWDSNVPHVFLPHHGVIKENGNSAKLRVVYDASSKTSGGISLNDTLMTGPIIQVNISDVLLQFHAHNVVLCLPVTSVKCTFRDYGTTPSSKVSVGALAGISCRPPVCL